MKLFGVTAVGINGRVGSQSDFNALRMAFRNVWWTSQWRRPAFTLIAGGIGTL